MTPEYAIQWPPQVGILPYAEDLVPKWTHSVLQEPDFCSEWTAAHRATELALQCQQSTHCPTATNTCPARKREGSASVSFDPWVDVFLGDVGSYDMYHTTVHSDALSVIEKPWSSRRVCAACPEPLVTFQYQRDLSVQVEQLFEGFLKLDVDLSSKSASAVPLGDPLSLSEAVLIPRLHVPDDSQCEFALSPPCAVMKTCPDSEYEATALRSSHVSCPVFDLHDDSLSSVPVDFEFHRQPLGDPLFLSEAVLIPRSHIPDESQGEFAPSSPCEVMQARPDSKYEVTAPRPSHVSCPVFDLHGDSLSSVPVDFEFHQHSSISAQFESVDSLEEGPSYMLHGQLTGSASLPQIARPLQCPTSEQGSSASRLDAPSQSPDQNPSTVAPHGPGSPIQLPPFAQQMMINLPMEFLSNPVRIVQGVLVRTWYLHHVNIPRSLQARQVMLTGPPHLWRAQILTLWNDFLIPCEDITLDLVSPNPPRNWHEVSIIFDLILAQGLYTGRFSGLTTISPTITDPSLRMYAIAVSFPSDVSGQDIITEADVQPLCNQFDCLVFHARAQLFVDFNPVHRMHHGDSFVIYLSKKVLTAPEPSVVPLPALDPAPEPDALPDVEGGQSAGSGHDAIPMEGIDTHVAHDLPADEERKRINLYRLDRTPVSAWVRWHRYSHLLHDVLQATGLVPADLVAIHPVLAKPIGEAPHEISIIVQQLGDIAPGSSESLVLLDTAFHQQGPVIPAQAVIQIDRKVVKVPNPLTRLGLLHLARVANYCEVTRDACIVSANYAIWNFQTVAPRTLLHGSYCQIQVPPMQVRGTETCRAASLIEDASDSLPPTFAQVYPQLPHHARVNTRPSREDGRHSPQACVGIGMLGICTRPRQCHVGEEHRCLEQTFEVPLPVQAAPIIPNVPDWDDFVREFFPLFDELSEVEIPEEGPCLLVTTWYIHHDRAPSCLVGRLVRLSNQPAQWLGLLTAPWSHMILPFENIALRIVKPGPVSDVPGLKVVHVILEQGLQQSRYVALFSVLFQGMHGDVTHRRAQSVPTHLSQQVIARILSIQELCRARRCEAWSGRNFFRPHQLEPIFSGIGISFSVDAFRNRYGGQSASAETSQAAASSGHAPQYMSFREEDATLFPFPSDSSGSETSVIPEHVPSRLVPELTVIWQHYLMTTDVRPFRFYVESWFCDHDRFPRTNRGREVLLSPDPDTWKQDLLNKWRDMIDPRVETFIYVVSPTPIGGPSEVIAHVLLAQHQHRGFVSALITTMAPGDDIWDPPRVALKLPSVVDKGLLIQESGLFMFCPPFMPNSVCSATYGASQVVQDALREATSGDSFLCVAEPSTVAESAVEENMQNLDDLHSLFNLIGSVVSSLVTNVVQAIRSFPAWQQQVDVLSSGLSEVQLEIESYIASQQVQSGFVRNPTVADAAGDSGVAFSCPRCLSCESVIHQHLSALFADRSAVEVPVWFVDPLRHPSCFSSRPALLPKQSHAWWHALVQPWALEVWHHDDVFVVPVLHSACTDAVSSLHVLLVQHSIPGLMPALVTFDSHDNSSQQRQVAFSVPIDLTETYLRSAVPSFFPECHDLPSLAFSMCSGTHEWQAGQERGQYAVDITIEVAPPVVQSFRDCTLPCEAAGQSIASDGALDARRSPVSASVPCPGFPVMLVLDAVLPKARLDPVSHFDDKLNTLEWSHDDNWQESISQSLDLSFGPVPSGMKLPASTQRALLEAMIGPIGPYELVEIFVDGATSCTAAGWSVVLIAHHAGSARLLGTLAGPVVLGRHSAGWIGASTLDNIAAELSGLVAALATALQIRFPCPVVIRPDLSLSRLIAQELATTVSNPELAKLCRVLSSWTPPNVGFEEVRGHSQHAWNDLADALAKNVLIHPDDHPVVCFGKVHDFVKESHDLEWAWTQSLPFSMKHCFPTCVQDTVWQFGPSVRKVDMPLNDSEPLPSPLAFSCKMATINVLALDKIESQTEVGRRTGHRTLRLDHQLHAAKFHLVGLQETRTLQGQFQSEHYHILSSGCVGPSAARFGCELWLHRSLPIMHTPEGKPIVIDDCHAAVCHADPRRLFVRLDHHTLHFFAIVLHAPCLGKAAGDATAPIDVLKEWWAETSQIWHQHVGTAMTCAFVDANATLASETTSFFQEHHADPTTPQSLVFEEFLVGHELYAPSTFAAHHHGPSCTWTHSSGRRMRLDYVLLSRGFFEMVSRSETWPSYDGTFSHEDHIPACVDLSGWLSCVSAADKTHWDEQALQDPVRCQAFQAALATLPLPSWEISVDAHCQVYETQYLQLAKQFFSCTSKSRKRPTLQADTLSAIAFKRHVLDCGRAWGFMATADFREELKIIETHVRKLVTRDLQIFYDQLLVRLQEAGQLHDHKQMFRTLTRLGGKKHKRNAAVKPLPMLKDPAGHLVKSYTQQQQIWLRQFAAIEAGVPMSKQALFRADSSGLGLALDLPEACSFPTDWQLHQVVSKLKRGRVPGPNAITPCLLKAGGGTFTKQFTALTTKVVAHGKEPTSWKGGKLIPLFKGKDSPLDPLAYRAIYISDHTSKIYHRFLRQRLELPWDQNMDLLQLGGRKSLGTDIAHHMLEAHQFWCRSQKLPSAIVFFDLRAAFYSVLRQALTQIEIDSTTLTAALRRFGISDLTWTAWLEQASQDHALIAASPHIEKLIQDCMTNTFFTIDGLPGVCATTRGTRPGDPLGDLLFNLIMRLVLKDTHELIHEATEVAWLGSPESCVSFADANTIPRCAYFDVSYVDDAAVALHAETLPDTEHLIQVVVESFHAAAAKRGLEINFSQGKTEVMWNLVGRGSRALKIRLHDAGQCLCWDSLQEHFQLRVSHSYRHLGSWMQTARSHQREIAQRASLAMQSWGSLARSFYHKRYVGQRAKTIAFQSLSMSRMMYNAHTWIGITDDMIAKWQQKLRKPLGLMTKPYLRGVHPTQVDTVDLFAFAQVLPPMDQIHLARLRYLKRLLQYCPQGLWDLLFQSKHLPTSWLDLCRASFAWFQKFYQAPGLPADACDLSAWLSYVALDTSWKGRLQKAARGCLCFRTATAEQRVWLKSFETHFVAGGGILPVAQTLAAETWICDQCNKSFASRRALATHAGRAHGYRRLVKYYAVDNVCNACAKIYHTRKRLIEHLRDATACLHVLQACFPPLSDEQVIAMDAQDHATTLDLRAQGWGASKSLIPMRKICGPLLPGPTSPDAAVMYAKWSARNPDGGTAFDQLQGHLRAPHDTVQPQVRLFEADMPAFVFQSDGGMNAGDGRFSLHGLARETAILHIRCQVFVHFFSGYRRKGDLHDLLEQRVFPDGQQLFVLSVDMCLQRERGDLASSSSLSWWLERIKSGLICGAGGGAPLRVLLCGPLA